MLLFGDNVLKADPLMVKNNVTILREKAGISVYELAKRCGFISAGRVLGKKISEHIIVF